MTCVADCFIIQSFKGGVGASTCVNWFKSHFSLRNGCKAIVRTVRFGVVILCQYGYGVEYCYGCVGIVPVSSNGVKSYNG